MTSEVISDVKKINLNINKLSIINGTKPAKVSDNVLNGIKNYYQNNSISKLKNKEEYRQRVKRLYDNLKGINPIDTKINNIIYSKQYLEKGITIKTNTNSLKQLWIEFRLIYNEHSRSKKEVNKKSEPIKERNIDKYMENKESYVLSNFDEIFDKLNQKVDGTSKYVEEFKNMQTTIMNSNNVLENSKKVFDAEKLAFEKYIKEEKEKLEKAKDEFEAIKKAQDLKIEKEKEKIDKNYQRLQELTNKFNEQVNKLINK